MAGDKLPKKRRFGGRKKVVPKQKIVPQVTRIAGNGIKLQEAISAGVSEEETALHFDAGPPPELNSLKRLTKQVNGVVIDIERARQDGGLELARDRILTSTKANRDFRKGASKKVEYHEHDKLFSSLANLSVASEQGRISNDNLAMNYKTKKKDPELKLEDYFTPYKGRDIAYNPSKDAQLNLLRKIGKK